MAETFAWLWGFGGGVFVGLMVGAWLAYTSQAWRTAGVTVDRRYTFPPAHPHTKESGNG